MATTTYVPLATYTAPSAASTYTFNTISGSYTDLVLVIVGNNNSGTGNDNFALRFNSDTGSNYSDTALKGNGSSATSDRRTNQTLGYVGQMYPTITSTIVQIQNYSNSTTYKTAISRFNDTSSGSVMGSRVVLWRNTNAITSITVVTGGDSWASGTTMTLYGIANADTGALATGGVITYDSTYYYHTFGSSGTFTPKQSLTADVLVIAGGGGAGGGDGEGGAGAGGLVYNASTSLANATAYTVTVGAGGTGATGLSATKGGNSNLTGGALSLTAAVGGGTSPGGHSRTDGGSGAGGTYSEGYAGYYAGTATSGQGNNGGTGQIISSSYSIGGGGGGAGSAGANATTTNAGNGGNGSSTYSSWANATGTGVNGYYAGGGGGGTDYRVSGNLNGTGGLGGAGNGGVNGAAGTNAVVNTGSGGGAGGYNGSFNAGGNGGSGIVIIRYPKA